MKNAIRCAKHVAIGVIAGLAICAGFGAVMAFIIVGAVKSVTFFQLDPACSLFFAFAYLGVIGGALFGAEKCWRSRA
jgi:hypothetical protein